VERREKKKGERRKGPIGFSLSWGRISKEEEKRAILSRKGIRGGERKTPECLATLYGWEKK